MPQGNKQPSGSGAGCPPATPDMNSSVLADVTNTAPSRLPKVSSKLTAVLHNQPSDAESSSAPMLLVTSGDSPIPAHVANLSNTTDNPMEFNDSSSKAIYIPLMYHYQHMS